MDKSTEHPRAEQSRDDQPAQSGWTIDGEYIEQKKTPSVEEDDIKPRWRGIVGLDGRLDCSA